MFSRAEMQLMWIPAPEDTDDKEKPVKKETAKKSDAFDSDKDTEQKPDKGEMSGYRLLLPLATSGNGPVTIRATYRDDYGRRYEAWSTKAVQPPAP
jgi:hypothetical protein